MPAPALPRISCRTNTPVSTRTYYTRLIGEESDERTVVIPIRLVEVVCEASDLVP